MITSNCLQKSLDALVDLTKLSLVALWNFFYLLQN